ncbi:MAG: YgjV family protein [Clostridia bacterium]|nr:YgjV family protein [Clostridia bacterium]
MIEIITQGIGFCGAGLNFLSFQQNKRSKIIGFQIGAALLFIMHYILLGITNGADAFTGAALNFIGLSRSIVFINNDKRWAKSPLWLVLFIIVSVVAGVLTWEDWYSFLPPLAMILTTVSYWMKNETKIRLITFPSSPCWLVFNIITGSVAGIVTECVVMSSLIIAIVRYDILKKDKVKK